MSRIDELIQQLCPDGVEYKMLGEIAEFTYGYTAKAQDKGDARFIRITDIGNNGFLNHEDAKYITLSDESKKYLLEKGDLLVARTGATYGKTLIITSSEKSVYASFLIKITLNPNIIIHKFYWHFSRSKSYWDQAFRLVSSSSQPQFNTGALKKISIPIPPLPVQEEIVRILDKFTALEAELEAELEARRKQYEFYRDQLLTFGDEVEWRPLGEVCGDIENIRWTEVKNKVFCYIDLSSVDRDFHKITTVSEITNETAPSRAQQIVQINDILLGTTRPLLKRFCIIPEKYNGQICSTGYCVLRPIQTVVLPLWIYYQISLQRFYDYIEKYQKGASYPAISDSDVKRYKIPVPPLAEQERIVAILDKFDALVNDISSGLPAELEMRRKQYEYYRDRLLTFKPLAKEA